MKNHLLWRNILVSLVAIVAAVFVAAAQKSNHAAGSQPDKAPKNSETQKQQDQRPKDLRLEYAEVPMYPQLGRLARISGTVEVQVTVKDGEVVKTEVKSGPPVLTQATIKNILTWRFYHLVNGRFTTKFIYLLETNDLLDPQNPKVELQLPLLVRITAVRVSEICAEAVVK
jgi:outer membrane biosynthesis protein TonB